MGVTGPDAAVGKGRSTMATNSKGPKRLEDFPEDEIPLSLRPLNGVALDVMESVLGHSRDFTNYQKDFAWQYTVCCLDKGAQLRQPLAALAYAYQLANPNRTDQQTNNLKRLSAAIRAHPPEQVASFKALIEKFTTPAAPPKPIIMGSEEDEGADGDRKQEKPQGYIASMQHCLKGTFEQPLINYNEAVSHARSALLAYPDHPDVIIQAAVCYKARAMKEKDLPPDLRVQDMQKALELMDTFIRVSLQPAYRENPEFRARRTVVSAQCEAMREVLHKAQKKLDKKRKDE
jgi:hypothetical protein